MDQSTNSNSSARLSDSLNINRSRGPPRGLFGSVLFHDESPPSLLRRRLERQRALHVAALDSPMEDVQPESGYMSPADSQPEDNDKADSADEEEEDVMTLKELKTISSDVLLLLLPIRDYEYLMSVQEPFINQPVPEKWFDEIADSTKRTGFTISDAGLNDLSFLLSSRKFREKALPGWSTLTLHAHIDDVNFTFVPHVSLVQFDQLVERLSLILNDLPDLNQIRLRPYHSRRPIEDERTAGVQVFKLEEHERRDSARVLSGAFQCVASAISRSSAKIEVLDASFMSIMGTEVLAGLLDSSFKIDCDFDDIGSEQGVLPQLEDLKDLKVSIELSPFTPEYKMSTAERLPHLKHFLSFCPNLEILSLSTRELADPSFLVRAAVSSEVLRSVFFDMESSPPKINSSLKNLSTLELSMVSLTPELLRSIVDGLPRLETLTFFRTFFSSDIRDPFEIYQREMEAGARSLDRSVLPDAKIVAVLHLTGSKRAVYTARDGYAYRRPKQQKTSNYNKFLTNSRPLHTHINPTADQLLKIVASQPQLKRPKNLRFSHMGKVRFVKKRDVIQSDLGQDDLGDVASNMLEDCECDYEREMEDGEEQDIACGCRLSTDDLLKYVKERAVTFNGDQVFKDNTWTGLCLNESVTGSFINYDTINLRLEN